MVLQQVANIVPEKTSEEADAEDEADEPQRPDDVPDKDDLVDVGVVLGLVFSSLWLVVDDVFYYFAVIPRNLFYVLILLQLREPEEQTGELQEEGESAVPLGNEII